MRFPSKRITLKNGQEAILRSPEVSDASELLEHLKCVCAETNFLMRYPEECTMTLAQEEAFCRDICESDYDLMILCQVGDRIAGNCHISFKRHIKNRHRATVAIALLSEYWNLGIVSALFQEMIAAARNRGIEQLELEVIEGNDRAMHLYQKIGFQIVAKKPNAIRLKDGTRLSEYYLILPL